MYSVADYGRMIRDKARLEAYAQALERTVTTETVVADIGAGTGIFTVLACRAGARHVYALEPGEVFPVLEEVVAENGFADRVTCLRAPSTEITLPERADVIIADLRGALPFFGHHLAAVLDMRERHLAPGGTLIAARDTLRVAVGAAPKFHDRMVGPWIEPERATFAATRRYIVNTFHSPRGEDAGMLSSAETWFEIDYRTFTELRAAGQARMQVTHPGTAHGLLLWFDCEAIAGSGFSNAPGANPNSVYSQRMFFWPEAVALQPGDVVEAELHADPVGDDYIWRWNTTIRDAGGKPRKEFRQSTFFGFPVAAETLPQRAAGHRPVLNDDGAVERFILEQMDGTRSVEAIAQEVERQFPRRFRQPRKAFNLVSELSVRFSRRNGK